MKVDIDIRDSKGAVLTTVTGEAVEICGFSCATHRTIKFIDKKVIIGNDFRVSELSTGAKVSEATTPSLAISYAERKIKASGVEATKTLIRTKLKGFADAQIQSNTVLG